MLSGVRAQIAIRIVGDDLDVLRGEGAALACPPRPTIPGLADLELEQVPPRGRSRFTTRLCTGRAVRRVAGDPAAPACRR